MRVSLALCTAASLVTLSSWAYSAPIHYDESVSGDLDAALLTYFAFDVGANTVSGAMSFYSIASPGSDAQLVVDTDPFLIGLAKGLAVTDANVVIQFTALNSNTTRFDWTWNLIDFSTNAQISTCFNLLNASSCPESPSQGPLFSGYILSSPSYMLNYSGGFEYPDATQSAGGMFTYSMTFNVAQVAEPSGVYLLLAGIAAISLRIRGTPRPREA